MPVSLIVLDALGSQAHDLAHPQGSGSEFRPAKETADEFGDFIDALSGQSDRDNTITFVRMTIMLATEAFAQTGRGLGRQAGWLLSLPLA